MIIIIKTIMHDPNYTILNTQTENRNYYILINKNTKNHTPTERQIQNKSLTLYVKIRNYIQSNLTNYEGFNVRHSPGTAVVSGTD